MATLEDKILGEKLQNYCSSSEGEDDDEESGSRNGSDNDISGDEEGNSPASLQRSKPMNKETQTPPINEWTGQASNTGPKGVLEDWRQFKRREVETRLALAAEGIAVAKKLTLAVKPEREEEEDKKMKELEDEMAELMDEEFLQRYQKQRMQELMSQLKKVPKYGKVISLNSQEEFLKAIDKEDSKVTVIIHVYSPGVLACTTMDGCLTVLAEHYPAVKFCRIQATVAGVSLRFKAEGVPALLVYKGGEMIGNFVKLAQEFGEDFFASDVERFLREYGLLSED